MVFDDQELAELCRKYDTAYANLAEQLGKPLSKAAANELAYYCLLEPRSQIGGPIGNQTLRGLLARHPCTSVPGP